MCNFQLQDLLQELFFNWQKSALSLELKYKVIFVKEYQSNQIDVEFLLQKWLSPW